MSAFGTLFSIREIGNLLDAIPSQAPVAPTAQYDVPLEKELLIKNPALAVKTIQGWKFKAGETLRDALPLWGKWARDPKPLGIIQQGWKGCHKIRLRPAWFRPYAMNQIERDTWDMEVTALWQAGVIRP